MIREAALYFARQDDAGTALEAVASTPLAFRAVMAAVRGGCRRVYVPARLRDTVVGRAIEQTPSARAATVWLDASTPSPGALLLVPASALVPPAALLPLLAATPPSRLGASRGSGAPVAVVPAGVVRELWPALARGEAIGSALTDALGRAEPLAEVEAGWYAPIASSRGKRAAERLLYASLGSAVDTRIDRLFHRRLSHPLTRLALALRIGPNPITLASLVVGLGAVWCFWQASPAQALLGIALYAGAVILDHADGEVARLTYAESPVGEWLDVAVDTAVHSLLVVALGFAGQSVAGRGCAVLGFVAAAGFIGSAAMAKTSPPTGTSGLGAVLDSLSNRDGFYAMLALFVLGLAAWPPALVFLMVVVAVGSHAFWLGRLAFRLAGRGEAPQSTRAIETP